VFVWVSINQGEDLLAVPAALVPVDVADGLALAVPLVVAVVLPLVPFISFKIIRFYQ